MDIGTELNDIMHERKCDSNTALLILFGGESVNESESIYEPISAEYKSGWKYHQLGTGNRRSKSISNRTKF